MLTISTKPIIITGSKTFYAKLAKTDFDHAGPSYIITKCNWKHNYSIHSANDPYDVFIKLNKTVNFVEFYVKSKGKTRLLYKKIIIFVNFSIPLFFRFWEKKSISIEPKSLLIITNRKLLELQLVHKNKNHDQNKILISSGKTRKLFEAKNLQTVDITLNIGKGLKLIKLFSIDTALNKTFIGFRLAIRNKYLSDPKLHPSHSNSFSKWNNLYSKVKKKGMIPFSDIKYAVIINATNYGYEQIKDCLEVYSNQLYKNFHIFLFSECNDIKKHFYDFKIKFVHCTHDFRLEWSRM